MDVKTLFASIDAMDTEKFLGFLTDDASFKFGNADAAVGKEAIKKAVSDFFGLIKGLSHKIINTWEVEDAVICHGEVTYTKKDDSEITLPFANIFRMKGDKISDYSVYIDIGPLFQ
ncbi:nuclear transport factor 2 family protein [Candidatus Woesearchaeota archaeon]|nr:nuclear transport factor 2 family protein [Candidatus Woesearchaeota archaeon]